MERLCGCAGPRCRGSREQGQGPDLLEGPGERRHPWPALGETQHDGSAAIDEASGEGEETGAHGAGDGELIIGMDVAELGTSSG